ncbi:protealysin inhibitor emfourin [Janthinobacterium aquaticum]|uniref:protealysin inhibitor emfourin n=1 Tax=Janthinobacterium sp. FT58W TaxID=2654254 RepID=UPI0012655B21|nr:protealysin inhibitor emfourin [Janthinobacterium sp. FT58W]KAB8042222.1 hypothetical protein GCM43_14200 [Janthinobacterium sp. FT58W]
MKISATSSGGFAGLSEHYEIDTQVHPQGRAVEAALAHAGLFAQLQESVQPVGADLRRWQIVVESPEGRSSMTFIEDGSAASAPWQALVAHLRQQG